MLFEGATFASNSAIAKVRMGVARHGWPEMLQKLFQNTNFRDICVRRVKYRQIHLFLTCWDILEIVMHIQEKKYSRVQIN